MKHYLIDQGMKFCEINNPMAKIWVIQALPFMILIENVSTLLIISFIHRIQTINRRTKSQVLSFSPNQEKNSFNKNQILTLSNAHLENFRSKKMKDYVMDDNVF
jgi:hypothetical protein